MPQARSPVPGSTMRTPRWRRTSRLAWVAAWFHMFTFMAGATRERVAGLNRRLVLADIDIYGLREVQASLEDWFLSVTTRLGDPS